jgi:hypothetical protein
MKEAHNILDWVIRITHHNVLFYPPRRKRKAKQQTKLRLCLSLRPPGTTMKMSFNDLSPLGLWSKSSHLSQLIVPIMERVGYYHAVSF